MERFLCRVKMKPDTSHIQTLASNKDIFEISNLTTFALKP